MPMGTHTYGPQHLFARFRSASSVYYIGTCVAAPEPEHEKSRIPIMNDLAGRNEPFQIVKDGENAVIYATMNRFDWSLLQTIRGLDSSNSPVTAPLSGDTFAGQESFDTRGTLVIGITDFQLLIWNEYNTVAGASGTANDAAPVRIYASVELVKYKESSAGTRVAEVACAFKATSVYKISTMGFIGGAGNTLGGLYSDSLAAADTTLAALEALVAASGA